MYTNLTEKELLKLAAQRKQPFHILDPSPWPLIISGALFILTVGMAMYMHAYQGGFYFVVLGLTFVIFSMIFWWRDVIRESTYEGHHTKEVMKNLRVGMILFIVSEIFFFLGFFWAFFHSSLAPTMEIAAIWPPLGIEILNPWDIPFLNTIILLTSGAAVTWSHHAIIHNNREETLYGLILTVVLAAIFTLFQVFEYVNAGFNINDSVYGATFYLATGFHGFHVLIGTIFLAVCYTRINQYQMTANHHVGFESAIAYWHFVDIVWLFLFVAVYYWGGI